MHERDQGAAPDNLQSSGHQPAPGHAAVAPGKTPATSRLTTPVQRKAQGGAQSAAGAASTGSDDWTEVAFRPDVHQRPSPAGGQAVQGQVVQRQEEDAGGGDAEGEQAESQSMTSLREELDGWGSDSTRILQILREASDSDKQAILRDAAVMAKLRSTLSRGEMLQALSLLNAPLQQKLNAAMDGWGCDAAEIRRLVASASNAEKTAVLGDSALIARLGDELSRADMLAVLTTLDAPLALRLRAAMDGWGCDAQTILSLSQHASDADKAAVLADAGLVDRLRSELSADEFTEVTTRLQARLANPSAPASGGAHGEVGVDGAFNAPPPDTTPAAEVEADLRVRILHQADNPLVVAATPTMEQLHQVITEPVSEEGILPVSRTVGDTGNPATQELVADDSTLFIGGTPSMDDVHQGGLADCYFLASIASIIQSDTSQISGMIRPAGSNVSVRFYRYDAAQTPSWIPVDIIVDNHLLQPVDGSGQPTGRPRFGQVRAAQTPKVSRWWEDYNAGALSVHAAHVYELAMWAPLMEKAFASYAQQYGQYGGYQPGSAHAQTDAAGNQRSGYDIIGGGIAHFSYPIVYGPDCLQFQQTNMNFTAGANNVMANLPALQNLLRVMGEGVPEGQAFNMTVGTGRDTAVNRLNSQITVALGAGDIDDHDPLKADLQALQTLITTWSGATGNARNTALGNVGQAAANLVAPGTHAVLHDASAAAAYRDLNELGNVVANITTDASAGQRFTYAWHSYSVLGASFKDSAGEDLTLTQSNLATQAGNIDPQQTTVHLRNPHGTNEPNEHGTGITGADDGEFDLTLDQFFRAFQFQQWGVVRV